MKLEGKVAIVTGAGQGIGRVIAMSLAKEGADVAVADINAETARNVAEEIKATMGRRALAIKADVGKSDEVNEMVNITLREFGKVDILVNNAGGSDKERGSDFRDSTEEVWDFVLARNLKGVLNCTRAVINHMIDRKSGKIVSIASLTGVTGVAGLADYSAAKAGIIGFSKALAKEVGCHNINVNCVSPGPIRSSLSPRISGKVHNLLASKVVLPRIGQPEDIAAAVAFLVSEDASFITGQNLPVCGGATIS